MRLKLQNRWIVLAIAALLMISVPWFLLSREPEAPPEKPPLVISKVKSQEIVDANMSLQKPIFNPERSPTYAEDLIARMSAEPAVSEEAAEQVPAPTLVGVVSRRRGKAVAIVKGQDGNAQTLSPGQNVDGWRLVRVGKSTARFASGNGAVDVNLDFANKAMGGPAPAEPKLPEDQVE